MAAPRSVPVNYVGGPLQSLVAEGAGTGGAIDLKGGYSNFTCQVQPSTVGAGTCSVRIDGSLDGTNWVALSAATTASTAGRVFNSTGGFTVGHVRLVATAAGSTDTEIDGWVSARP